MNGKANKEVSEVTAAPVYGGIQPIFYEMRVQRGTLQREQKLLPASLKERLLNNFEISINKAQCL